MTPPEVSEELPEDNSAESIEEQQRAALVAYMDAATAADRADTLREHAKILLTGAVNRLLWQTIIAARVSLDSRDISGLRHLRLELRRCRYEGLEKGLVPVKATAAVREAVVALLEAEGDETARQIIQTHRNELFQRSADQLLFYTSWLYQDDWPQAHANWQRRELLKSCCQEAGKAAVERFLKTTAGAARRGYLQAHPELLWPEVALGLRYGAEHPPDPRSGQILGEALKDYLEGAAALGAEVLPEAKSLPVPVAAAEPLSQALRSMLAEVRSWEVQLVNDAAAAAPLAAASVQALSQLPPTAGVEVRAALRNAAAKGYLYSSGPDRAGELARAADYVANTLTELPPKRNPGLFRNAEAVLLECFRVPLADGGPDLRVAERLYGKARITGGPARDPGHVSALHTAFGRVFLSRLSEDGNSALGLAAACFKEALRHLPEDAESQAIASLQFELGATYRMLSQGDRTLLGQLVECLESGLSALPPGGSPQHYVTAQMDLALGFAGLTIGELAYNLKMAIFHYEQALRLCTPEFEASTHAALKNHLGNALRRLGALEGSSAIRRAISCYHEALVYRSPERSPVEHAKTLNNLALAHAALPEDVIGNLERAIGYYRTALHYCPATADPAEYSRILTNLGIAYEKRATSDSSEDLHRAIACFDEARRYQGGEQSPLGYAMGLVNLGAALCLLETDEAVQQAMRYFMTASTVLERYPREFARLQANLGAALSLLRGGDKETLLRQAIPYFEKAATAETRRDDPLAYGTIRMNLGTVLLRLTPEADHANELRAVACFQEALGVFTPAEEHPVEYARAMDQLGRVYAGMKDPASFRKAIDSFLEALRLRTPESDPDGHRETEASLGDAYFEAGDWAEADKAYAAALAMDELLFRGGSRRRVWDKQSVVYSRAAFAAAQVRTASAGLQIFDRGQARVLANALRLAAACPAGVPAEVWTAFEAAAAAAHDTRNNVKNVRPGDFQTGTPLVMERQEAARESQGRLDEAIAQVRRHAPHFLEEFGVTDVCGQLDEGTALAGLCVTSKGTKVFILTREGSPRQFDLPDFTTDNVAGLVLNRGTADAGKTDGWIVSYLRRETDQWQWLATMERVLLDLGRQVMQPVVAALGPEVNHLVFIGMGQLALLPLHAALLSESPQVRLGDRYRVSYAHSVHVYDECLRRARRAHGDDLFAIVNPRDDVNLPYAAFEAWAIGEHFQAKTLCSGQRATRAVFSSEARGHAFIHFAGHGNYNWLAPGKSGLELADGHLNLADLQSGMADLSAAKLVTLSACETGLVDVLKRTEEEYVGLPAGFLLAGVPCVVSSLWEVPELSTSLLMERFWANLRDEKMTIPAALGAAQQWVRTLSIEAVAEKASACLARATPRHEPKLWEWHRRYSCRARQTPDEKPFEHPYYWAAFTVSGA